MQELVGQPGNHLDATGKSAGAETLLVIGMAYGHVQQSDFNGASKDGYRWNNEQ